MKSFVLKVLKETELENGDSEIEFGFDDDFAKFYEEKFKKKLTQENFQETVLEALERALEENPSNSTGLKTPNSRELKTSKTTK